MSLPPRSPRSYPNVTPDDVLNFTEPTKDFLCPLSANRQQIEFLEFTISDYATKNIIFMVGRDHPPPVDMDIDLEALDENTYRLIKYEFSEDVLRLPSIQTSLVFSVGDVEVPNFRMVERHYFRNKVRLIKSSMDIRGSLKLVKSYDFSFGFCIPTSTNTWDAVYHVPPLDEELIEAMIANPYETKSDSFYFVDNSLIMHNKASYKYLPEDKAQAKKSYEDRFGGAKGAKKQGSKYDSDEGEGDAGDEGLEGDEDSMCCSEARSRGREQKAGGKYDDEEEDLDGEQRILGAGGARRDARTMSSDTDREEEESWSKEANYY